MHQHGLQASINEWHRQHSSRSDCLHALQQAPIAIFFQLERWTQRSHGIHKLMNEFPFGVGATVDLPCFAQSQVLTVAWYKYRLLTVAIHTGVTPRSGHYRAILGGLRQHPEGSSKWLSMIVDLVDDDRDIRMCSLNIMQHAACNCYVLGLCRES